MRDRLDQYTMSQFIDIACGDYSGIGAEPENAKRIAEGLIERYNELSEPVAAKTRIVEAETSSRHNAKITLYSILLNLIRVYGAYDDVRAILGEMRLTNVSAIMDNERMTSKIEQLLRSEISQRDRMLKEKQADSGGTASEDEIRASFDKQTASLMAHFKFSINHDTITASVYASLVNMACKQQRQKSS